MAIRDAVRAKWPASNRNRWPGSIATGGRLLAISDVVNTAPLTPELQADTALLCGCIAGAAPVERIESWLAQAGFVDVRVIPQPESRELVASWAPGRGIENFVASATVEARKPGGDGASRG